MGTMNLNKNDFVFFWHEYEEYGEFSQWYKSDFTIEGVTYSTCEQYMMAQKALLFHDKEIYNKIMQSTSPKECKKLGREIKNFDDKIWKDKNEQIIYEGNYAKFSQNNDLKEKLISTGNKTLAEASPFDKIYGIGMDANNPDITNPSTWNGKNILGNVLMRIRDKLMGYGT